MAQTFDKEHYCAQFGVKKDYFMYQKERYMVNYTLTYNASMNNKGTPFVVGYKEDDPTSYLRIKVFLVEEWLD